MNFTFSTIFSYSPGHTGQGHPDTEKAQVSHVMMSQLESQRSQSLAERVCSDVGWQPQPITVSTVTQALSSSHGRLGPSQYQGGLRQVLSHPTDRFYVVQLYPVLYFSTTDSETEIVQLNNIVLPYVK